MYRTLESSFSKWQCPSAEEAGGSGGRGGVTDDNNFRTFSGVHHQSEGRREAAYSDSDEL
jgi:hypothetical protein